MFELELRQNTWGKMGFRSYSDGSPEAGATEKALEMLGYKSNPYFQFDSYRFVSDPKAPPGYFRLLTPVRAVTSYQPSLQWHNEPVRVSFCFENINERPALEIPSIPNLYSGKIIPTGNEQNWEKTHEQIISELQEISRLLADCKWFFPSDRFDRFVRPSKENKFWTDQKGRKVSFRRIRFGWDGGYWGTLWHLKQ